MNIQLFNYHLPKNSIAQKRAKKTRLLILGRKKDLVKFDIFSHLPHYLSSGDLLIFNNTKVFKSRLFGRLDTGGQVEIFLLKQNGQAWEALGRPAKKLHLDRKIIFTPTVHGIIKDRQNEQIKIQFNVPRKTLDKFIAKYGTIPIPPYIKNEPRALAEYQTIYAKKVGSVAAPTAGFHFTKKLFRELQQKGIQTAELALHVGLGTFLPVKTKRIEEHQMHAEEVYLPADVIQKIIETKKRGGRIIAVGTTTTRALEGVAARFGRLQAYQGPINIFITPGFKFKVIDGLVTNFHLPKSTLLILVSALAGRKNILKVYNLAIKKNFKFFSFGDAMFIN